MANVTITSRDLKNKNTGMDIYVPRYETIPGPLGGTVLYHVIVVTRLFYFKSQGKYKESDVVQFMIPQKYATFEDLYHKLLQKFSSVVFCPLPRKALIVNESVINDRRQVMEAVLQQVAKTPKLACSSLTLDFLGVETQKDGTPLEDVEETDGQQHREEKEKSTTEETADVDLFGAEEPKQSDRVDDVGDGDDANDDDDELLLFAKSAKPLTEKSSIFKVEEKEDDINDLFIPAGALERKPIKLETEDNSELLNIDDDLDKLLNITKPEKPAKPAKPVVPKPRLKPKPQIKPKPMPKPRFQETKESANDELFAVSTKKSEQESEDLFAPRKSSFRKQEDEDTLDDIFKKPAKPVFPDDDDDDDALFKTSSDMSADDISSYIQKNLKDDSDKLELF